MYSVAPDRGSCVVAMSGGVDSSVAALLAATAGAARAAFTLRLSDEDAPGPGRCCASRDVRDARLIADALGLAHHVLDRRAEFSSRVVEPFVEAYLEGRTPIPCVACNDQLKFVDLLARARALGAARVATGHYARTVREGGRVRLLRAADESRDQTYFLHGLTQDQLGAAWFPLGDLHKEDVRAMAREASLPVADKPDSQEICFVPDGDVAAFVESRAALSGREPAPGPVVDEQGSVIGRHRGVHAFTVGQRKGLGSHGRPLHVLSVDAAAATVVAGPRERLLAAGCRVARFNWIAAPREGAFRAEVRVRHQRHGVPASVAAAGDGVSIRFDAPHGPVSPGQAAVVYEGDEVIGGGAIVSTLPS